MSKSNQVVPSLLKEAGQRGILSTTSLQTLNALDLGTAIQDALGVSADDIQASEVFLLSLLVDDSSSIRFGNNTQNMRDAYNLILEAQSESKSEDDFLVHVRMLNSGILVPYVVLREAPRLDTQNYNPQGGTPLYDRAIELLGTVVAKEREFKRQGVPVRTYSVIISDGNDESSSRHAADVANLVRDMTNSEEHNHIVAAWGVNDGATDFQRVFREIGVPDQLILTSGSDKHSIRQTAGVISKSVKMASQTSAGFSKTFAGGFGGSAP